MPSNIVVTDRDEHLWSKAKTIAKKQYKVSEGSDKFYKIVMGIYNNMKGGSIIKSINSEDTMNTNLSLTEYPLLEKAHVENQGDSLNNEHLEDYPLLQKARVKAHPRKMKSGKIVQVREHTDIRTKKAPKPGSDYDEWRNTRIQAKNIFRMLREKHSGDIPKMRAGMEELLKQNKTKPDQAKVVHQEFNKYFKITDSRTKKDKGKWSNKPYKPNMTNNELMLRNFKESREVPRGQGTRMARAVMENLGYKQVKLMSVEDGKIMTGSVNTEKEFAVLYLQTATDQWIDSKAFPDNGISRERLALLVKDAPNKKITIITNMGVQLAKLDSLNANINVIKVPAGLKTKKTIDDMIVKKSLDNYPLLQKARVKAHPRRMKSGKIVQVREHTDIRTKKVISQKEFQGHYNFPEDSAKDLDAAFDNLYEIALRQDTFDTKERIANKIQQWKNAKKRGDPSTSFYTEKTIAETTIAKQKSEVKGMWDRLVSAIKSGNTKYLTEHVRYDQKWTVVAFEHITRRKLPKTNVGIKEALAKMFPSDQGKKAGRKDRNLSVADKHQIKIAKQTLKMPDAMVGVMGQSKEEARKVLAKFGAKKSISDHLSEFPLLHKAHVKTYQRKMQSGRVVQVREHETSVQKKRAEEEIKSRGGVEQPTKYKLGDTFNNTNGNMDIDGMLDYAINKVPTKLTTQTPMHPLSELFISLEDANYHKLANPLFSALKLEGNGLRKDAEPFLVEFVARAKAEKAGKEYTGKIAMDTTSKEAKKFFSNREKDLQAEVKKIREKLAESSKKAKEKTKKNQPTSKKRYTEQGKTIHSQVGQKALFMMGAKNLGIGQDKNGLGYFSFRIGRNSKGINYVKIQLNGTDTYDVEFGAIRAGNYKVKSTAKNVYVDQLHKILESHTGMRTSLGMMGKSIKRKLQIGDNIMKSTERPVLDSVKFPMLAKAHADLKKSMSFKINGQKLKTAIEGKIATCKGELIVLEKEYPPVAVNSEDVSEKVAEDAPVTKKEVVLKVTDHWKVRQKKREIEELETYARNVNVKISYNLDKYELSQFGL